jgi:hypothetical protein
MTRTTRQRHCANPFCPAWYDSPLDWPDPWPRAYCSAACHAAVKRATAKPAKPRAHLVNAAPSKRPRAISEASPAQRLKRNGMPSIVSGATEGLDAAHLAPRGFRGGCDDPLCTVSLTRAEHRAFDSGALDILPHLIAHELFDEIAHAVLHYRGDLIALLERLTGERWVPAREEAA